MDNTKKRPATAAPPACPEGLNLPRSTREDYVATVGQQLAAFEERLDEFESDMESTGWDDIGDFRGQLDDLRSRLKSLRTRSEGLTAVDDAAWPEAYREMDEGLLDAAGMMKAFEAGLMTVLPE